MRKISLFLASILLAGCFVGCNNNSAENNKTTSANETGEVSFYKTDEDTFEIKTKYCSLFYPKKWQKTVKTEIVDKTPYVVKFIASENKKEIPLFDIAFGKTDKGSKLGKIKISEKYYDVYLVDHSSEWPDDISKDKNSNLYAMSEDVNVIISKLIYDSGMVTEE